MRFIRKDRMSFLNGLSLKTKLILLYAVLLFSSVLAIGYYSYWSVWTLLINNKEQQIKKEVNPAVERWVEKVKLGHTYNVKGNELLLSAKRLVCDLTSYDMRAVILNKKGNIIAVCKKSYGRIEDFGYAKRVLSGYGSVGYSKYVGNKLTFIYFIPIEANFKGKKTVFGVLRIETPIQEINNFIRSYAYREISVMGIVLLIGAFAGYWIVENGLKRLDTLSLACKRMSQGNFSKIIDAGNKKDEIGVVFDSFNQMADRLQAVFNSQKRFSSDVAHELLTPLSGLQGSLEVLLRGAQDEPKNVDRLSKNMYKEVMHLINVCKGLLELSRLENTSNINKKRMVLSDFMEEFLNRAKLLYRNNPLILQKGPFVSLLADYDLLQQALHNVLSNAVYCSNSDSPVIIGWRLIPDFVEIWIKDYGCGMDKETVARIFEPFYRGKNNNRYEGSGLGLPLAKSIIEAHGGLIEINSKKGEGTTVIFKLPLKPH